MAICMYLNHNYNMKNKKLLGVITKSPVENEMIKGPMFSLTIEQVKLVVDYLRTMDFWEEDYITENALIIDNDVVFEYLKIFPRFFRCDNYLYDFRAVNVDNYFANIQSKSQKEQFALTSYCVKTDQKAYQICLGYYTREKVIEVFGGALMASRQFVLKKEHIDIFIGRESVRDFYEFDFDSFWYAIEPVDLEDYVFGSKDEWWGMPGPDFLPFEYINN